MATEKPTSTRRTDRAEPPIRKPLAGDIPLAQVIDPIVREGDLYERLPDGKVHCYACAHHCTINPGGRGICQVRYNLGGTLYVPWGYVAALQCDPTEKKPFFHVHPGSDTLTFGMLGCDLHCSYCFPGDTVVVSNHGPMKFEDIFRIGSRYEQRSDAEIAYPDGLEAVAASGTKRRVKAVFKHPYRGQLTIIKPYYLPELRCTPDHPVYATEDVRREPQPIAASQVTKKHYLAIPRHYSFSSSQVIDVSKVLGTHELTYRVTWDLSADERAFIAEATARGETSRQIGAKLGKDPSYIRHVRSKLARGLGADTRTRGALIEGDRLRFPGERRPGIPLSVSLDTDMARLLGLYCAEGGIQQLKNRPNSFSMNFSFSPREVELVEEARHLLARCLSVEARVVKRETTLAASICKASAALLFKSLAGDRSNVKRVPRMLFDAPRTVVKAYLDALVQGDGFRYAKGKTTVTTVSTELAYGIAWLVLKLGYLPSIYVKSMPPTRVIMGREINLSPKQYVVVWYEDSPITRKVVETEDYYLVPLRDVTLTEYDGDVYNMEVEGEHNYLAGFFLVHNCQNWDISQAMRDSYAGRPPTQVTPEQLVSMAHRNGATCIASSYNEPLITSEWAMAVFKQAKAAGLTCLYVSNGNVTREVLDYIRPYTDGYKIDLKTMNDKNYRKLGAPLAHILDGVRMVHEMRFWLEIVTLVIPGFNDSDAELRDAAQFIKALSPDIPWHVTAFHKDYKMQDPDNTDARTLFRATEIGYREGLRYIYPGNLPGQVGDYEHTYCPTCRHLLIERIGYVILDYQLTDDGKCPRCQTPIPGIWPQSKADVRTGTVGDLWFRVPRGV